MGIAFAVIVVLVILIVCAAALHPQWGRRAYIDSAFAWTPWQTYGASVTGYDLAGVTALRRATTREVPTLDDRATLAAVSAMRGDGDAALQAYLAAMRAVWRGERGTQVPTLSIVDHASAFAAAHSSPDLSAAAELAREGLCRGFRGGVPLTGPTVEGHLTFTESPHNSADAGIIACARAILLRLRSEQADATLPSLAEIWAEMEADLESLSEGRGGRMAEVGRVLEALAEDPLSTESLGRVWLRAKDPAVEGGNVRLAVFTALRECLLDGLESQVVACPDGRATRILGSLAGVDRDPRNWVFATTTQFKRDLVDRTRLIPDPYCRASLIHEYAAALPPGAFPPWAVAAAMVESGLDPTTPAGLTRP